MYMYIYIFVYRPMDRLIEYAGRNAGRLVDRQIGRWIDRLMMISLDR